MDTKFGLETLSIWSLGCPNCRVHHRCSLTLWRLLPRSTGSCITRSSWSSTCRATGPVKHKNDNYKRQLHRTPSGQSICR